MTDIRDLAGSSADEYVLAADQPHRSRVRLKSSELYDADDLSPEGEFPEFGTFLEVETVEEGEPEWWECPKALADLVVEKADALDAGVTDLVVDVDEVVKTTSGEWRYVAAVSAADGDGD